MRWRRVSCWPPLLQASAVLGTLHALRERGGAHPFQPNAGPIMRIGNNGYAHQAHYDNKHNVFVQLIGRKRFVLWAPNQTAHLCPFPRLPPL